MDALLNSALHRAMQGIRTVDGSVPVHLETSRTLQDVGDLLQRALDRVAVRLVNMAVRDRRPLSLALARQCLGPEHGLCCELCQRRLHGQDTAQQGSCQFLPSEHQPVEDTDEAEEEALDLR